MKDNKQLYKTMRKVKFGTQWTDNSITDSVIKKLMERKR